MFCRLHIGGFQVNFKRFYIFQRLIKEDHSISKEMHFILLWIQEVFLVKMCAAKNLTGTFMGISDQVCKTGVGTPLA